MTEQKRTAEELEKTKEALFRSQKLEAIGKLTGGVAHDFNNLLAVIVSGIELLGARIHSPADLKVLESMRRAAARGATLTQQLLSFARQQTLHQEKHNLNQIIANFESILKRVCNETVQFALKLAEQLNLVLVDAAQFEAALLNLITNAQDAMPCGGSLTIATENVHLADNQVGKLLAGEYVRVTVRDSGSGMSREVVERAIEPFFTTKEVGRGTGLGLSQVFGLAQQCNGELVIETEEGNGTCISLYFPAVSAAIDEGVNKAPRSIEETEKILVVDDQPDVLEITVELLTSLGYEVLSASGGKDAIAVLNQVSNIDVLFTDVRMPGMDGITLAKEARKLRPTIKVILVSGFAPSLLDEDDVSVREFAFLTKPYQLSDVAKLLRKVAL
jgi:CheY-like chemotaxis protein/nitrogen-specific signal transduction histidine kinase